jgi:hypothetical protein
MASFQKGNVPDATAVKPWYGVHNNGLPIHSSLLNIVLHD